jgi:tetratricopeptide (TPR) repeat protein
VEAGRLEEAEKAFLAALASSPSHAPTSVALAKLYSQMGRHSEAQRVLEEALRLRPDGVVLWNELGSLLLATDRPQEAESRFRRVLEAQPGNVRALIGLARSLADMGRLAEGTALIETAIAERPDAGELHFFLGALRVEIGDDAGALDALTRAKDLGVNHPGVDVFRGMALAGLARIDEAETVYRSVLDRNPNAPEAHKQLGLLLAERNPGEALLHLKKALSSLPRDAMALSAAGRAAYSLNHDAEAADFLRRALEIAPSDTTAWITLGRIHFRRNESSKARQAFEKALLASPEAPEAHYYLGELDAAQLELEKAVEHYRKAASFESERALAKVLAKLGRYQEAGQALARALPLAKDPSSQGELRYLEGFLHVEQGEDELAIASLLEARRLAPYHLQASYLLGTTLARLGRTEESREELGRFQELKSFERDKEKLEHRILERPDDADAYVPLIELYLDSGRKAEARIYLAKALLLSPGNPRLLELEQRGR